MSLGTGRPIILRDENCSRLGRALLNHPMVSPTDVRLVSLVELVAQKSQGSYSISRYGHLTFSSVLCSSNLRDSGTSQRDSQPQFARDNPPSERSAG